MNIPEPKKRKITTSAFYVGFALCTVTLKCRIELAVYSNIIAVNRSQVSGLTAQLNFMHTHTLLYGKRDTGSRV